MSFVYILKTSSGKYYVGSTVDLEKRLKHHQGGYTPSTKKLGTIELIFSQKYDSLEEARNIESRIKRLKRRDYIEKIVKEGKIKIKPR